MNDNLFDVCDNAIEQILENEYFEKLKRFGIKNIYVFGIANNSN